MPLATNALTLIETNLTLIQEGGRPKVISIGYLTAVQHGAINSIRQREGKPLLAEPEILFMGRHLYESRSADGYSIADMLIMIERVLHETAIVQPHHKMTGIMNTTIRADGYGNMVKDLGVLELYARRPKAELLSVIPKGDALKPKHHRN